MRKSSLIAAQATGVIKELEAKMQTVEVCL